MDFDVSKIGIDPNALENAALGDFDDYVEKPTAQAPVNEPTSTMNTSYNQGASAYNNNTGTQGYDSNMGAQMGGPTGYDPYTGAPIYGNNAGTQGYDPNMGAQMGEPTGYDPYTGAPIYDNNAGTQGHDYNSGATTDSGYDSYVGTQGGDTDVGAPVNKPLGFDPYTGDPIYNQQPDNIQNTPGVSGSGKAKMDTIKMIIPIVAVAVVAVVVGVILLNSFGGVKGQAKKFFKAVKEENSKIIVDMMDYDTMSKLYDAANKKFNYDEDEFLDKEENSWDEGIGWIELALAFSGADSNSELSYEITDVESIDADEFAEDVLGVSNDDDVDDFVDEVGSMKFKKVELKIVAEDDDDDEDVSLDLYFAKDGGWKFVDAE